MRKEDAYETAAVPFYHYWMRTGLDVFWYEDVDFDFMSADFLVRCSVEVEGVEASGSCSAMRHFVNVGQYLICGCIVDRNVRDTLESKRLDV